MLNVLNMKNRGKGNTYFKNVISKEGACLYFESLIDRKLSGRTHLPYKRDSYFSRIIYLLY